MFFRSETTSTTVARHRSSREVVGFILQVWIWARMPARRRPGQLLAVSHIAFTSPLAGIHEYIVRMALNRTSSPLSSRARSPSRYASKICSQQLVLSVSVSTPYRKLVSTLVFRLMIPIPLQLSPFARVRDQVIFKMSGLSHLTSQMVGSHSMFPLSPARTVMACAYQFRIPHIPSNLQPHSSANPFMPMSFKCTSLRII